jgi:hypothetical protein
MGYFSLRHVVLVFTFLGIQQATAQTYLHTALWIRYAPTYALSTHWMLQGDLHYRRQSHPERNAVNPFGSPLLLGGRVGIGYRTRYWAYTLFPIMYFHSYPLLGSTADLRRPPVPEWRPTALAEYTTALPHRMALRLRAGYEYRLFTNPDLPTTGRFRARALLRHELGRQTYGQLWNETLLTAPPNVPASGHVFELNRTNIAIGYVFSPHTTLEMGYQFTHRQRRSLTEFDAEHALTVTLFQALNRRAE